MGQFTKTSRRNKMEWRPNIINIGGDFPPGGTARWRRICRSLGRWLFLGATPRGHYSRMITPDRWLVDRCGIIEPLIQIGMRLEVSLRLL